jgi:protein-disulfide isomerase
MPLLEQVLERNPDKIKIAFKHFPLKMHKAALVAATASLYADTQGKFYEFHNLLMQNSKSLNEEKILDIAVEIGFQRSEVKKQIMNPVLLKKIQKDIADGKQAGVNSVPKVFINGHLLKQRTMEEFQKLIDKEMKKIK